MTYRQLQPQKFAICPLWIELTAWHNFELVWKMYLLEGVVLWVEEEGLCMLACILDRGNHKVYNHSTVDSNVDSTVDMPEIAADWKS